MVKIQDINSAILNTLKQADGVEYSQDYDEITEGIVNTPVIQVYFQNKQTAVNSDTERNTFKGIVRQTTITFFVDLILDPRAWIDQTFVQMYPLIDAIDTILEGQNTKPYFGLDGIKAFNYLTERISVEYAGTIYPAVRWTLELRVF